MTNNPSQRLALLFLSLALFEVVFLSSLVPLDGAFASWVEGHRSCTFDYLTSLVKNSPLLVLIALGCVCLGWFCIHRRWHDAWHLSRAVVLGGFLSELLKTGAERARPSVLPPLITGNSFPSGHVVGALLIAGTLVFALSRERWATWIKLSCAGTLAGLVGIIIWQRLYMAHHWLSDVVGSVLLVGAWLCFALPRPTTERFSGRFGIVCVGLLIIYGVFYSLPQARISLPSVLTLNEKPDFEFSFGTSIQDGLVGAWGERTSEPAGPITWLRQGEASIEVPLQKSQAYTLKLAVRPFLQSEAFACFPLEVLVNHHQAGPLLLYRGWREYTLHLDPQWTVPGVNFITFRTGTAFPISVGDQGLVAFRRLRLFATKAGLTAKNNHAS